MGDKAPSYPAEEALRAQLTLAQRFLTAQTSEAAIELKPGEMRIDQPVPPGAHVAGSLLRDGKPASLILDTPQTPAEVFAFYDARLPALGWAADVFMRRGGFIPSSPPFMPSRYISDERGAMLILTVNERTEGGSTVLFTLADAPARAQRERRPYEHMVLQQAIPSLIAPLGANLVIEGSSGSDTSWRTYARMNTTLDLEAIMAGYDKQLNMGGWRRLDGGIAGAVGWSLWTVAVESRSMIGALIALRIPERQNEYLLEARLEAAERLQPGGGWTPYAPLVGTGGPGRRR
jgi:hypothetical protein